MAIVSKVDAHSCETQQQIHTNYKLSTRMGLILLRTCGSSVLLRWQSQHTLYVQRACQVSWWDAGGLGKFTSRWPDTPDTPMARTRSTVVHLTTQRIFVKAWNRPQIGFRKDGIRNRSDCVLYNWNC